MGRGRAGRKSRREEAEEDMFKKASVEGAGEGGERGKRQRRRWSTTHSCVLQGAGGCTFHRTLRT
jgi:hypothetical protein